MERWGRSRPTMWSCLCKELEMKEKEKRIKEEEEEEEIKEEEAEKKGERRAYKLYYFVDYVCDGLS